MNLALSSLILLLLLLPGFAFRISLFLPTWKGAFRTRSIAEEIALAVGMAALFHEAGLHLYQWLCGEAVELKNWLYLLGGAPESASQVNRVSQAIASGYVPFIAYSVIQVILACFAGAMTFRLVRLTRLDICFEFMRILGLWDYLLRGEYDYLPDPSASFREKLQYWCSLAFRERFCIERAPVVYVSAVVNQSTSSYLY